ncbi:MAG TPA: CRISPR-associated endonuclease Cas1 [Balneolales bacterium]|nr:CRISPR-associated endonuclease Cas1 [Balneolales bacterium]
MQLYLTTFGTFLHVYKGMFEVKIPKDDKKIKKKIAPQKVTTIVLDKGTTLTWEAVQVALQYNIDIVFVEGDGAPIGRIWHSKLGSTTRIRKRQLEASMNQEAVYWVKSWIGDKLNNQIELFKKLKKHRKTRRDEMDQLISKIEETVAKIKKLEGDHISEIEGSLRGFEGSAGRAYFGNLSTLLTAQYQFKGRSFRPAEDAFNAFLNYAYGILYSRIERCVMIAGLDPYIGFLHRDDYNKRSFVFDFIEPYRPFADYAIFKLFSAKKVKQSHTREIKNGIGLTKDGKKMIVQAFIEQFDVEKIRYRGRNQTRMNAIQQDAHTFANTLIEK